MVNGQRLLQCVPFFLFLVLVLGGGYYQYVRVLHTRFPVYSMDYRLVHYWWLFDIYSSPIPILAASV